MLEGRRAETEAIELLLERARGGRSGTLVVRGEAGIGKSALLAHAADAAADMRVLRSTGIESEHGMPYAGLHMLLGPHLAQADSLTGPQARALRGALGQGEAAAGGDRFLVGLAVLTLLSDLAEERPLLCLVDDAHWLDGPTAEALLFAARRLDAEPIAMLFAARTLDAPEFAAPGLPELTLAGLDDAAAESLLAGHAAGLSPNARHVILTEAMGNPLALLELPAARREDRAAGSTYERLRRTFAERLAALPEATRALLAAAASDDLGDLGVVLAAAGRLGASAADLEPAERARLVRSGQGRIEFRHPLIRTAAYQDAPLRLRLAAHRELAEVYAARGDVCHHAWHVGRGATGPDEGAAAVLEKAAEVERAHGGNAGTAVMYESAARLSPDARDRGRRLAVAARAAADAGMPAEAVRLAGDAAADLADPVERAGLVLLRASLADEQDRAGEAHRLLLATALEVAGRDPGTAGRLMFEAALSAGNAGDFGALARTAERAAELGVPDAARVRAVATMFAGQQPLKAGGVAALRDLLDWMGDRAGPRDRVRAALWHIMLGDPAGARAIAAPLEERFRADGAIGLLSPALMVLSRALLMLGRSRDALTAATEGMDVARDTGQHRIRIYQATVLALLAAQRGDEAECAAQAAEALARDVPPSSVHAAGALALLDLGLGRHEAALHRLAALLSGPDRQGGIGSLPDLVEAAVRAGRPEEGRDAAAAYRTWAAQIGRPWTDAIALRCAALLAPSDDVYARAVELHRQDTVPFERARTELLYGEWLRRSHRRNDARALLHSALDIFERMGATPWAERARTELRAAGESVVDAGVRDEDLAARLTPQELQVVRLAADGLSNRDIGGRLFLSPRTVGYHLYKAYPKLGVTSRGELARLDLGITASSS
ncbi:helix-turn-helix transcriptional regulator [Actinomadura macrotermitis]|uniref:HTH luxR-type domain-containing protein n=1 Tax=Actinomadura macrotermitis TaxID=2585200 RepID=A0A7K0BX27_9ACTN|nr:helix-turn-helix transcriptional regulator [Actinomadura macrotermitis]MQY05728.1 hypothetical protein [Actinomadura macrotermitis]